MLSLVSWPVSFLQKYLAGRSRNPAVTESVQSWSGADLKQNIVEDERSFWGHLDDLLPRGDPTPTPHLSCLHYPHGNTVRLVEASEMSTLSLFTTDSLRELGIESSAEIELNIRQKHTQIGFLTTGRSSVSQVLRRPASTQVRLTEATHVLDVKNVSSNGSNTHVTSSSNWWDGFWESQHNFQSLVSNLAWSKESHLTSKHCPQPESGTKASVAKPTELFVQCNDGSESMPRECTGPASHKEELMDNGNLHTVRPESLSSYEGLPLQHQPSISICSRLVSAGAVTACSEVTVLTPDQDNGYSSLEEEHSVSRMYKVKTSCEDLEGLEEMKEEESSAASGGGNRETGGETPELKEEGWSTLAGWTEAVPEAGAADLSESEDGEAEAGGPAASPLTTPICQNKAIAYIMGSPCSDDSQSDSESSGDEEDDDDGFDSEGSSSTCSDSDSLEDDESSDEEQQAEAERLWNSLCRSRDPYHPFNFTARIQTVAASPRAAPCSPAAGLPPASPLACSPAASPPSPSPPLQRAEEEAWDDSTSASEVDEAESARLWNSFGCSLDPYSPLNFKAPIKTLEPPRAGALPQAEKLLCGSACRPASAPAAPSLPRPQEEAEERLDSGFSEGLPITVTGAPGPSTTTTNTTSSSTGCVKEKKVRFSEEVEEFFASCGEEEEERRGPWEELARDRCRFRRRCQDVGAVVGPVLEDQHRRRVYHRLLHPPACS